LYVSYILILH